MPCPDKFKESLAVFRVAQPIQDEIWSGYETLVSGAPKAKKAAFFKRAMDILDARFAPDAVRDLLEWNACCKSGARDKASRAFARVNAGLPLAEKLEKIGRARYMNMGVPSLTPDGMLRVDAVSYVADGRFACGCATFSRLKREYSVSRSYCFCCGGHFKYHYQLMLGVRLSQTEVVSSPLDTDGASPCVFLYRIDA